MRRNHRTSAPPGSRGAPLPWKTRSETRRRRLLVTGATAILLVIGASLGLRMVPLPASLFHPSPPGWEFVDRHGAPLRRTLDTQERFAVRIPEGDLPPAVIAATLAAEDHRFWRHHGVDWRAKLRAAGQWIRHGRVISGGSSITEQLIKLAEPRPRTISTKLIEAAQAMRLEQLWDKPRILAEYLNRLDHGNLQAGSAAASRHYFGKSPADLSAAEAAFLAGLPQSPTRLNPRRNFARAKARQEWILSRMQALGWLTPAEFVRAVVEPIRLVPPRREFEAPHFVEMLLLAGAGEADFSSGPDRANPQPIRTTVDLELQHFTERALRENLARLRDQSARDGAAAVLDNRTGELLALVGSENWFGPDAGQVNGALARRSAGSTLKPFTYLLAFEQDAFPASIVADVPTEFVTPTGVFRPVNYDRHWHGPTSYREALGSSLNVPAVRVLDSVGGPAVLQQRLQAWGLSTLERPAGEYGLGLTIGNAEVKLLELANAYATLARLGEWRPMKFVRSPIVQALSISFSENNAVREASGRELSGGPRTAVACWLIADVLADNDARSLAFGSDSPLRFDFPVACKTGTSTGFRDNWAVGYTPEYTVAVWIGNFDGHPMREVASIRGAAPVMHAIMEHLHDRFGTTWFARPSGIVECAVHPLTGRRLRPDARVEGQRDYFPVDHPPTEEADGDYDTLGRVRLSNEYRAWLEAGPTRLTDRAVVAAEADRAPLRLVSPLPGTVFYLDPDLPSESRWIPLKASAECRWESDTLECRNVPHPMAVMSPGRHRIQAQGPGTSTKVETWIEVREL